MPDTYIRNSGLIGLSNFVFATITKDDSTGTTYGTPQKIGEAINVKVTPKVTNLTQYGDDAILDHANELQSVDLEIEVVALPLSVQAALLGHTINAGVMQRGVNDVAPYVAIGYKRKKLNGKYRYTWLYKGIFEPITDEGQTKDDKPAIKTNKLKATFIPRVSDGLFDVSADEEEPLFTQATADGWFTTVQGTVIV
jgi:phi13 family phage major tail protein